MLLESTSTTKSRKTRTRTPQHPTEVRAYRFPMTVTPTQSTKLASVLEICLNLRNRLVQDRIENRVEVKKHKQAGEEAKHTTRADQYKTVSLYSKTDSALAKLHSQVKQNIACRVDEGSKRWFEALKAGRTGVKPPKQIDGKKYRSFTYPQHGNGAHIKSGKVFLSGIGEFRINDYRKIRGLKKTVTIKRSQGRWWCIVTAAIQEKDQVDLKPLAGNQEDVGVDPGLTALLTDSHGTSYDPPKVYREGQRALKYAQRDLSRKFEARRAQYQVLVTQAKAAGQSVPELKEVPYSNRLKGQIKVVAKLHTKFENTRDHYQKKIASVLSDQYRKVAVEEHGVNFMIRNRRLAKSASDRAIAKQKQLLQSKLGSRYHATANRREGIGGNSQSCLCGASVPKELSERIHRCPECGLTGNRDHVSANIVQQIAFGTISSTLGYVGPEPTRYAGSISTLCHSKAKDVEGAKLEAAKANPASRKASEPPMKRRPSANRKKSKTGGGKPTPVGKTSKHRPNGVPIGRHGAVDT